MLSQVCPKLRDRRQREATAPLSDAQGAFSCVLGTGCRMEGFLRKAVGGGISVG